MYARYVPPSKGSTPRKTSSPSPAPAPASAPSPAPAKTRPKLREDFGYSRYVPPVKATEANGQSPEPKAGKRKRTAGVEPAAQQPTPEPKKTKLAIDADHTVDGRSEGRHDAVEDEPSALAKKSKSKKKGEKKRKGETPTVDDASQLQPDDSHHNSGDVLLAAQDDHEAPVVKQPKSSSKRKSPEEALPEERTSPDDVKMLDADAPVANEAAPENAHEPKAAPKKMSRREKKKKKDREEAEANETKPAEDEEEAETAQDARHRSVLERKSKSLQIAAGANAKASDDETSDADQELHDLVPLPQPAQADIDTSRPSYDTLPLWLSAPIRVYQDTKMPFTDIGLLPKAARVLEDKGFKDAFAVQTAAIPLLLPSSQERPGDVLISAATGSGKTLAYALPIVRDISQGAITRLRALVVLPTRELVRQAHDVFDLCAKAYEGGDRKRVRIGMAIGSQMLRHEQETLMEQSVQYDPDTYEKILSQAQLEQAEGDEELDLEDADPRLGKWRGDVISHNSKVDVLICTPGRLVEHMEQTPGFNLDYVRWLVVDEADKLLAQSFQGWLGEVIAQFKSNSNGARDFPDMDYAGVRKVVLSATLTRDLSLLNQLALRRPRLIVLENEGDVQMAEHSLPNTLKEFAIRVHDTGLKPLYLLDLLQGPHMRAQALADGLSTPDSAPGHGAVSKVSRDARPTSTADDDSDTTSGSSSDSSSSSDSDSDSDSDSSSSSGSDSSFESGTDSEDAVAQVKARVNPSTLPPTCLIFTKSNESALRLTRLLTLIAPVLAPHISTLTSTMPTHVRRRTLRAFAAAESPVRLVVASDLVARGIDIPRLDHVVNYDLPPSVAGYVHRVGRTARAGRQGCAWTLVGDDESGWFWGKIAKGAGVRRAQKVERTRIEEMAEDKVEMYDKALAELGKEAADSRKR